MDPKELYERIITHAFLVGDEEDNGLEDEIRALQVALDYAISSVSENDSIDDLEDHLRSMHMVTPVTPSEEDLKRADRDQ